jgi:hypothetical protein
MTYSRRKKITIFLSTVLLLFTLCFWQVPKAQATLWPGIDPAIRTGLEEVMKLIDGLIVGVLKQQSIVMLNSQINTLAGRGAGGQPAFITNWQDYLINEPMHQTNVYMNDYVSRMTRGRGTYSGYSTEGFTGPGNYSAELQQVAQNTINDVLSPDQKTFEITYEGTPSQMLASNNFKNMEIYVNNSPWRISANVHAVTQRKLNNETLQAQSQSIANQGFPGTSTSPGILAKEMMANVQNMPNAVLANATSLSEVITSLVSQMISRSITQGFSSVQRSISKTTSSVNKFNSSVNKAIEESGPGARFDN